MYYLAAIALPLSSFAAATYAVGSLLALVGGF